MTIKKDQILNEDRLYSALDKLLNAERVLGGARMYWYSQGVVTSASVAIAIFCPQYRLVASAIAAIRFTGHVLDLSLVKWAQEQEKKKTANLLSELKKQYATPQDFLNSIINPVDTKRDLH